jgi:hypothetical protein
VHKLLGSDRIRGLLRSFVPVKRDEKGKLVRDRYRQIRSLIEHDEQYHRRFFELVKRFFPIVVRQMKRLTETQNLGRIVLRSGTGAVHRTACLKLLTTWMHDTASAWVWRTPPPHVPSPRGRTRWRRASILPRGLLAIRETMVYNERQRSLGGDRHGCHFSRKSKPSSVTSATGWGFPSRRISSPPSTRSSTRMSNS